MKKLIMAAVIGVSVSAAVGQTTPGGKTRSLAPTTAPSAKVEPKAPATIASVAEQLKAGGLELEQAGFPADKEFEVKWEMGLRFAEVEFFRVPSIAEGGVAIVRFKSNKSPMHVATTRLPAGFGYIAWNNFLIVMACPEEDWAGISDSCTLSGAKKGTAPTRTAGVDTRTEAADGNIRTQCDTLANQLELFSSVKSRTPDLAGKQWAELIEGGYVKNAPKNPLSPAEVSTKIVTGKSGSSVDPKTAGWVWNAQTKTLCAAGIDD